MAHHVQRGKLYSALMMSSSSPSKIIRLLLPSILTARQSCNQKSTLYLSSSTPNLSSAPETESTPRKVVVSSLPQFVNRRHLYPSQEFGASENSAVHIFSPRHQGFLRACRKCFLIENRQQLSTLKRNNDAPSETESLAATILEATEKIDVMAGSVLLSDVKSLIVKLTKCGLDFRLVQDLLSGKLWLLRQPDSTLTLCRLLSDHGMSPRMAQEVIHDIPYAYQNRLNSVPALINTTLSLLRSFGFSEDEVFSVVAKDSSVMFVDGTSIRMTLARLKALFPAADTKKVVFMTPNILSEDWPSTQAKFDYCIFKMGYVQSDIVKSAMFSRSLHHIQDRHLFLLRANVFKVVNKKLHPSLNPNPPLKRVVDSSDSAFVKLVEGATKHDYSIFKEMRELEREAEEEVEEDDLLDDEVYVV